MRARGAGPWRAEGTGGRRWPRGRDTRRSRWSSRGRVVWGCGRSWSAGRWRWHRVERVGDSEAAYLADLAEFRISSGESFVERAPIMDGGVEWLWEGGLCECGAG